MKYLLLAVLFLTACGSTSEGQGGNPPYGYNLETQAALVATTEAMNGQARATYQAGIAQATSTAGFVATATAWQLAADSRATSGAATATAESLNVTQTAAAMHGQETATAIANSGTATAVANLGDFDRQRLQAESERLRLENERQAAEVERARHWAAFTRYLPWLLLALLALAGVAIYVFIRQQSRPLIITVNGREEALVPPRYYNRLTVTRPEPLALPAPARQLPDNRPVELPPMTRGHVLIAGETGSGKTTALQAVLRRRRNVVVLDPHAAPNSWGEGVQVIGGGRDFQAIAAFMGQMRQLLSRRYNERARGVKDFDPVTVATDEMPAIVDAAGSEIGGLWREWVREGRKVGLYFVVSTQSTRVKTLGIEGEGDLLEAFDVLLLGKVAAAKFPALVAGMERPAVLQTLHNARPVVIPNGDIPLGGIPVPVINLPPEPSEPAEDPEANRIRTLAAEGLSRRAIEREVFGYDGGEAWKRVKDVLDRAATTNAAGHFSAAT